MEKLLNEMDYINASQLLDCEVASIKAVTEVESPKGGFYPDGRPTILFEAHIFGARTKHKYTTSHPKISSKKWDKSLYYGRVREYERLNAAMALDKDAALESASWGRFQIMGFNHKTCGYDNVHDFVADMNESENKQLLAFVNFIKNNPLLHKALKAKRWSVFARLYNGPAYAQNAYDKKIEKAYIKHSKV